MKLKTATLKDAALDWAVAKCLTGGELFQCGRVAHQVVLHSVGGTTAPYFMKDSGVIRCAFEPSENWSQGGPIIEREKMEFRNKGHYASYNDGPTFYGETHLIAAMRCYVTSKLGDEIEIPEELT